MQNPSEMYKKIGERLRKERERQGYTQEELAHKSKIPLTHLQCHELGIKRDMCAWELFEFCKALHINITQIFEDHEEEEPQVYWCNPGENFGASEEF